MLAKNNHIPDIKLPASVVALFDQMTEPYGIKNHESRYLYANQAILDVYGLKKFTDIIGKTEREINSKLVECALVVNEFMRQDRQVYDGHGQLNSLEVHPGAVAYPYLANKVPFRDESNRCVGVLAYAKKINVMGLNPFILQHMPGSLLLNKPDDFFTERECEVMFYRLQGMAPAAVALRLGLSEPVFAKCMQRLYLKAGTVHFDDFEDFCIGRHYHRYVPNRLISANKVKLFSIT